VREKIKVLKSSFESDDVVTVSDSSNSSSNTARAVLFFLSLSLSLSFREAKTKHPQRERERERESWRREEKCKNDSFSFFPIKNSRRTRDADTKIR
jgi:hypothetical protein